MTHPRPKTTTPYMMIINTLRKLRPGSEVQVALNAGGHFLQGQVAGSEHDDVLLIERRHAKGEPYAQTCVHASSIACITEYFEPGTVRDGVMVNISASSEFETMKRQRDGALRLLRTLAERNGMGAMSLGELVVDACDLLRDIEGPTYPDIDRRAEPDIAHLKAEGYDVHHGGPEDEASAGRWWWSLSKAGWLDTKTSAGYYDSERAAWAGAATHQRSDV